MARGVAVLLGTKKGVYVFRSGAARERWLSWCQITPGARAYACLSGCLDLMQLATERGLADPDGRQAILLRSR